MLLTQLLELADSKQGVQNKVPGFVAFQNFFRVFVAYLKYFPEHTFEQLHVRGKIRDPIFVPPIFLNAVSSRHYLLVFILRKILLSLTLSSSRFSCSLNTLFW